MIMKPSNNENCRFLDLNVNMLRSIFAGTNVVDVCVVYGLSENMLKKLSIINIMFNCSFILLKWGDNLFYLVTTNCLFLPIKYV